jgi:hypothetical protein
MSLFFIVPAFAQRDKKDVVYLKSGGAIKGQLITHDAEIVKINSSGNEWVFRNEEVDSISIFSRGKKEVDTKGYKQGFFMDTSMGVLVGNRYNNHSAPFSFMSSMNVRVASNLYLGAGAGVEFLEESYMPAYGQIQWRFRDTKFTPFINLQAGYLVALEDGNRYQSYYYYDYSSSSIPYPQYNSTIDAEGGYFINPSMGFQRFSSNDFGWFFSFGYRYHQLNYSGINDYKLETNLSRLSLRIGFIFK